MMPLQLTGRHMTISEEQKQYIDKKADRLRRVCPKIDELTFTLTKEKLNFVADGTFRAGRMSAVGTVTASQPLEAIDLLVDKLEHTLSRQKAKRSDHHLASREKNNSKAESLTPDNAVETEEPASDDEAEAEQATA
jgi:ribosomal subunit interface protein